MASSEKTNRKSLPLEVVKAKIKKGEIIGTENKNGLVFSKWKDKRDVYTLCTCHNLDIVETGKKNKNQENIMKPKVIIYYNNGKAGIDSSDQLLSYSTPVRKSIHWYHKVA